MKPIYGHFAAAAALTLGLAACIPPAPEPTPAPSPKPAARPSPPPAPVAAAPAPENWIDAPQTPGDWAYANNSATFGTGASPTQAALSLTCNPADRMISIARTIRGTNTASTMTLRTETQDRTLQARPATSQVPLSVAVVAARDPLLDAIALTRGRFAVETPGQPTLYLPAWAEVTRVIEDCR